MSWLDKGKTEKLNKSLEALKTTKPVAERIVCIHGDENCIRCNVLRMDEEQHTGTVYNDLVGDDVKDAIYNLNDVCQPVIKVLKKHASKVLLAGGYIRATVSDSEYNDIDLFVADKSTADKIKKDLAHGNTSKAKLIDDCCYSMTYKEQTIQIVWRYAFKAPVDLMEAFDFTAVKGCIWYDEATSNFTSICHPRFYRDISKRQLVYDRNPPENERSLSVARLLKYQSYGYEIGPESLARVILATFLNLDAEGGYDGVLQQLQNAYTPQSSRKPWEEISKKYIAPKKPKRTRQTYSSSNYSYGS